MQWRVHPLASLYWRCWDHEWVVFNVGSGQTHLLDEVTAAILSSIEDSPCDTALLSELGRQGTLNDDQLLWSETLNAVLDRLVGAGLIESTAP